MRDPHVEYLFFTVDSGRGNMSYQNPKAISFDNDIGNFHLENGKLTVELKKHFSDESQACEEVDSFLRTWEIQADLMHHPGEIRFTFEGSEIVDRNPPPPGESCVAQLEAAEVITVGEKVIVHSTRGEYPEPPSSFVTTLDVEVLHLRWKAHRDGKEPLQGTANFVLTYVEWMAGTRRGASKLFQIHPHVLKQLGRLCSEKGGILSLRKVPKKYKSPGRIDFVELSGQERNWLERAIRIVILRIGEHEAGASLAQITLADLPGLSI